jgi:ABC-type amino acid transport substrate-binding protein
MNALALALAVLWGSRLYFEYVVPQGNRAYQQLVQMDLAIKRAKTSLLNSERIKPLSPDGARTRIAAIQTRGTLRVGYPSDRLPWVFANAEGRLVGLDVDLAHLLAADLGVGLEFVNVVRGGLAVTPDRALRMRFTEPYVGATLAFVVRDHDRRRFATVSLLRKAGPLRVATPEVLYYDNLIRAALQDVQLISIKSPRDFFEAPEGQFDAMLFSAEGGSAWTLIFPRFSVVVPQPNVITGPIAFATPRSARAARLRQYLGRAQSPGRGRPAPVRLLDPRSRRPVDETALVRSP